ncbi:MAG: undecaprenyldiphospho-muramoylpentapeptide beta-N-acetylglucosaminyltransferase [Methylococcaceae bacterium]|nr:undecaprenyldiphospho-muramoylpentapeptide beta-N-acetylglucosaminyltransferase [Methylococcaceae bacterium]
MGKRIIIMAGGTGGHVFPALAVALFLQDKEWDVSWIGTQRGIEKTVVPAHGLEIDWLSVAGIRGKGTSAKLQNGIRLFKSFWQVFKIFRHRKPNVVLGFGGYVSGPGGMVASWLKIPLVIHEQNRVPGTTNKLLINKANRILEAFPESFPATYNAAYTGNPLRADFLNFPDKKVWTEESNREFRILIIGGSQGAKILNDLVPPTLAQMDKIKVIHQTGEIAFESVSKKYEKSSSNAQAVKFIDDIATSYQWADMIICRSGAMTISEVAAAGLPAIFIPLPHAIDDHQTANAKYLTDAGAGILLAQSDLTIETLLTAIKKIKNSLRNMSDLSKSKAKLDATNSVATICMKEAV